MEYKVLEITCRNPECGKSIKCKLPKQAQGFALKCPYCGKEHRVRLRGVEIKAGGNAAQTAAAEAACGNASAPAGGSADAGEVAPPPTKPLGKRGATGGGQITVIRRFGLSRKVYPLSLGRNTIGRYDEELHSDIEVKGDTFMSRRSVCIDVTEQDGACLFKLSVLNATNPVLHNERPLIAGESLYLNYGDCIRLGSTLLKFDKQKKS